MQVRPISARETYPLRLEILRAGLPPESAIFAGDDDESTQHFGAFTDGVLIGIATVLQASMPGSEEANSWQLRGMAVSPAHQKQGVGVALVEACAEYSTPQGGEVLWCNARTPAVGFYRRLGFKIVGEEFDIPGAGPHFWMQRIL